MITQRRALNIGKAATAIIAVALGAWGLVQLREARSNAEAREVWAKHEKVVTIALKGYYGTEEFGESVRFFRELTGIEMRMDMWTMGFSPTEGTAEDFERVKQWYAENADKLYYDASEGEVRVRGQEPRREREEEPREDPSLRTHLPG